MARAAAIHLRGLSGALVLLMGIAPVHAQRNTATCPDTVIVIDEHLRFRASTCQDLTCLKGFQNVSFDAFIRSDARYVNAYGVAGVPCRSYALPSVWRECDTVVAFDPPLRVELAVPPGLSAAMARKQVQVLTEEGRWLGIHGRETRVRVRQEGGGLIAILEVHRLVPRFTVCCGGVRKGMDVRLHFQRGLTPVAITTYVRPDTAGSPARQVGPRTWVMRMNCGEDPHLRITLRTESGAHVCAEPAWKDLRPRLRLSGKRCPKGSSYRLRRSYTIVHGALGPLRPVLVE